MVADLLIDAAVFRGTHNDFCFVDQAEVAGLEHPIEKLTAQLLFDGLVIGIVGKVVDFFRIVFEVVEFLVRF